MRRSGFSADQQRHTTVNGETEDITLGTWLKAMAARTHQISGSRRMAPHLQEEGSAVGRSTGRRGMQQAGVSVQRSPRRPVTTTSRQGDAGAPNRLARQCDVAPPDRVWVGDIPDLWTQEGWLYLSVLLDLHARKVVGWALRRRIDAAWTQEALRMALGRRGPAAGLMHHADRGSQDACGASPQVLVAHGMVCSMRRKGECLDTAVAERFFGS